MSVEQFRVVHFHLNQMPTQAEVDALSPGDEGQVDVCSIMYDPDDPTSCRVAVEVPRSTSPQDAIMQAAECVKRMLPSLSDAPWHEDGIDVLVRD